MPSAPKLPSSSSGKRERRGEAAGRALVAAWQASGLPQATFARRRGVSAQPPVAQPLRLGQRTSAATGKPVGFVEIPPVAASGPNSRNVQRVEVRAGVCIRVVPGFDPVLLRAVVSVLAGPVPAC